MTDTPVQQKYLFKPFFGSSHHWALDRLRQLPPSTRVLDVGAGSGALGSELKRIGVKNIQAVEPDVRAHENLKESYQRVENSLEAYPEKSFDAVLLLDVLEHVAQTDAFLGAVLSRLAPGGRLYLSVPNIAHWSVRLPLLFGFFKYTERGLLDKTHLQFFTRRRVRTLMNRQGGFQVKEFASSIPPFEFVLPRILWENGAFRVFSHLHHKAAQLLPGFFAYQHLVTLERDL